MSDGFLVPMLALIFMIKIVVKVLRDGRWSEEDAAILVPGDIISVKLGDIVPADSRLLDGDPLKIDQVGCPALNVCLPSQIIVLLLLRFLCFDLAVCTYWGVTSCHKRPWRWGLFWFYLQTGRD